MRAHPAHPLPPASRRRPCPARPADSDLARFAASARPALMRSALTLTRGHESRAEDLVSTVLVRLAARDGIDDLEQPLAYARRALTNAWNDAGRSELAQARALPRLVGEESAADLADDAVDREAVVASLRTLSDRERTVIVLRYWQDRPDHEIARALDCRPGTVRSLAHRSLQKLRRHLDPSVGA